MTNKQFWKTMKPFLTNKGCLITNDKILAKRLMSII